MEQVRLGKSGLVASVIGLGGGSSGRFGLANGGTPADAVRLIRTAIDEGISFFDGAGLCGDVDALMAQGLAGRRESVVIATKIHLGPDPVPLAGTRFANKLSSWIARRGGLVCSGAAARKRVERTLKALRTDRIDLLQLHAVSPRQYPHTGRVFSELIAMKEEGKIRAIGITEGFLTDPGHAMLQAALSEGIADTVMVAFNPVNSSAAELVLPAAARADVGVIGMYVLRDLLAHSAADRKRTNRLLELTGAASLSDLAYRYCRHQPGMGIVLTGTGDPGHLRQNIAAALAPPLTPSAIAEIRRTFAAPTAGE